MTKQRKWLQAKRCEMGMTHEEVASNSGIKRAYYTMIESGYRSPSVDVAKRIATALRFDWTIFFNSDGSEMTHSKAGPQSA
jgi:transcriptional regulator with XRE-family HTH domain